MNPFIKEQLNLVRVASLPQFDDDTLEIFIPKSDTDNEKLLLLDKSYIIELADYILHPFDNFNLHDNWNNGNVPQYKYLKCQVKNIVGKMINIEGTAIDMKTMQNINYSWYGWIPRKSIIVIKEL